MNLICYCDTIGIQMPFEIKLIYGLSKNHKQKLTPFPDKVSECLQACKLKLSKLSSKINWPGSILPFGANGPETLVTDGLQF